MQFPQSSLPGTGPQKERSSPERIRPSLSGSGKSRASNRRKTAICRQDQAGFLPPGGPRRGRSGRRWRVIASACCRRHAAILPWSPGNQHLRDIAAFQCLRPRVMRVFEQAGFEALLLARLLIAHDAGQQAHDRVEQDHRRRFAARKHVVADRDFLELACLDDPFVDALEAAADDDAPGPCANSRARPGSTAFRAGSSTGAAARRHAGEAASTAAARTSARKTMPAPPPAGVSST